MPITYWGPAKLWTEKLKPWEVPSHSELETNQILTIKHREYMAFMFLGGKATNISQMCQFFCHNEGWSLRMLRRLSTLPTPRQVKVNRPL